MEQRLTPQLIQSMAVLQKPVAELESYVANALETNAALELAEPESPEAGAAPRDEKTSDPSDLGFARLNRFNREYDLEGGDRAPHSSRRTASDDGHDPKLAAMANTEGKGSNLQEHLLAQWSLLELDDAVRRAGETIINRLDADGYLRILLPELAEQTRPPLDVATLERALTEVHKLEPAGIGARDAVECLRLQLDALPGDNSIERKMIEEHLDDMTHNRLPAIAKATGYSIGEVIEAMKAMRSMLCLHPGYLVGDRSVPPIRPDVVIEYAETGGGLNLRLARGNMPHLKIRDDVAALARGRGNEKETREFARKHVEEASALIDALHFRRQRLMQITQAIAEKQREFFDVGPTGLKVLRMSDLASELSCDPSTVSRTVADKYVQTPRGIFPLRYFFTGGTETDDGETMGWDRVKTRVRELVEGEDRANPLNDDQIAAVLKDEGMEISRRTVAKYRAQLNIPPTRQRRQY